MSLEVKALKVISTDATVDVYTILNYEFSKENDEPVLTFIDDNHSKYIIFQRTIKSVEIIREEVPDTTDCTSCQYLILRDMKDMKDPIDLESRWSAECKAGLFKLDREPPNEVRSYIDRIKYCKAFKGK